MLAAVRRRVLLLLVVMGALVPNAGLAAFITRHGFDLGLLLRQVFATSGSTFFFALDVVLSAIVLLTALALDDGRTRWPWLIVVMTLAIGPSCGLPLWLLLRQRPASQTPSPEPEPQSAGFSVRN